MSNEPKKTFSKSITGFIKRKKKTIITSVSALFLGVGFAFIGTIPKDEYKANLEKQEVVQAQINDQEDILSKTNNSYEELLNKKTELSNTLESLDSQINTLNNEIATKEQEKIAKEQARIEAERVAAEQARIEAERVAAEQARIAAERAAAEQAANNSANSGRNNSVDTNNVGAMVWKTATGKKYHRTNNCGNTNSGNATQISLSKAESLGLTPCSKCY